MHKIYTLKFIIRRENTPLKIWLAGSNNHQFFTKTNNPKLMMQYKTFLKPQTVINQEMFIRNCDLLGLFYNAVESLYCYNVIVRLERNIKSPQENSLFSSGVLHSVLYWFSLRQYHDYDWAIKWKISVVKCLFLTYFAIFRLLTRDHTYCKILHIINITFWGCHSHFSHITAWSYVKWLITDPTSYGSLVTAMSLTTSSTWNLCHLSHGPMKGRIWTITK